jgi:ABC-type transport system substrate-binding protein
MSEFLHSNRRVFLQMSALAAGAALMPAFGNAMAAGADGKITVASHTLARVIDARVHRSVIEQNVYMHIYDGLVDFDKDMNIRPRLATEWEMVDPTTWKFKLRQGVKFHNGEIFNAEAAKFSFDQYVNLDPPYLYKTNWDPAWPPVVEVQDDFTILVKTPKPIPNILNVLPRIGMLPPKATLEAEYANKPVGTGPFSVEQWEKGRKLTLKANESYWDGAPPVATLVFVTIEDSSARLAALQAGEVDFIWNVPLDRIEEVSQAFDIVESKRSLVNNMIAFNARAKQSPIANIKVRQALLFAFDGKSVIESLLAGAATQGTGPTPSMALGAYNGDGYPERDIEKAKALLAEAGYADGLELTLIAQAASFTNLPSIVEVLQAQLAEVGVTVTYAELDQGQMNERAEKEDWDLRTDGSTGATGEAQYFYNTARRNYGTKSAAADELLAKAALELDPSKRIPLISDAMKAWWEEVPFFWSFESGLVHAGRKGLKGVELIPNNWILMRHASVEA